MLATDSIRIFFNRKKKGIILKRKGFPQTGISIIVAFIWEWRIRFLTVVRNDKRRDDKTTIQIFCETIRIGCFISISLLSAFPLSKTA